MKALPGITIVCEFLGVLAVSTIQPVNLSPAISSGALESNHSADNFAADRDLFATPLHPGNQTISATPLFSDGTSIQEIAQSIISCIIDD
ncbi:MAG: hypothetical protein PVI97_05630 [Candidatus Thiodiazotropha sp.]|jgi:hypothetical protein